MDGQSSIQKAVSGPGCDSGQDHSRRLAERRPPAGSFPPIMRNKPNGRHSPVETQYLASLAHRRGRHIRWKETQNVASLQSAECVKQTQRRAGGPLGVRIAEFGMRNGKERQQVVRNKANPPAGGVCSCRDAISCVSGVSAGPVHSMRGDAKCCVSTKRGPNGTAISCSPAALGWDHR